MRSLLALVVLAFFGRTVTGASFSKLGCFPESAINDIVSYKDNYIYQSSGHCEQECSGSKIVALLNGKYCYCGDGMPNSNNIADESHCNVACQGYGEEMCGGMNYFLVYSDSDVQASFTESSSSTSTTISSLSTMSSSRSSETSTQTSSTSTQLSLSVSASSSEFASTDSMESTSLDTSSTISSTKHSSLSKSKTTSKTRVTTSVSTITSGPTGSVSSVTSIVKEYPTKSSSSSRATASASATSTNKDNNNHNSGSSLSGGAIAGIVVGCLAGIALLALLVFFFKKRRSDDDNDDEFTLSGPTHEKAQEYDIGPNPFNHGSTQNLRSTGVPSSNTPPYPTGPEGEYYRNLPQFGTDAYFFNKPSSEYGRRRLSDGSLPDMINRNTGSLKVVNN